MSWLITGLGNPGPKYAKTRHNIGFMLVDEVVRRSMGASKERFRGEFAQSELASERISLLKPLTFMNESGRSVRPACDFYKVPPERLLVIHDELDVPFGEIRLKYGGGEAGHRGLRSISQHLGTKDYFRLRMGIGRPSSDFRGTVADFVLDAFASAEAAVVDDWVGSGIEAVQLLIERGAEVAMKQINTRR